jgi:hypothetical protein
MWDHELNKNENINPYMLTDKSGVTAHFVCNKGHHFKRKIQTFTKNPVCPICMEYEKESKRKKSN